VHRACSPPAEAAGIPCVIGHGFGLDPSTIAEIMLPQPRAMSSPDSNAWATEGRRHDHDHTTRIYLPATPALPQGPGIGVSLDERKLEQYRSKH